MSAIDRTAYPRPGARLTREELGARYNLTETDLAFVQAGTRTGAGRLLLAMLLKARRDLGCFPAPNTIHAGTVAHLAAQLGMAHPTAWPDEVRLTKSLYRYQAAVRIYLSVTAYDAAAEQMLASTVLEAAETMSDPADLINRAIEALQAAAIDLPAFSTLDRLVNRLRAEDVAHDVDLVLDTLGGPTTGRFLRTLKHGGALFPVFPGFSDAEEAAKLGVTVSMTQVRSNGPQLAEFGRLLDAGTVRVAIDSTFPLADARKAHERAARGHIQGKIVLTVA